MLTLKEKLKNWNLEKEGLTPYSRFQKISVLTLSTPGSLPRGNSHPAFLSFPVILSQSSEEPERRSCLAPQGSETETSQSIVTQQSEEKYKSLLAACAHRLPWGPCRGHGTVEGLQLAWLSP